MNFLFNRIILRLECFFVFDELFSLLFNCSPNLLIKYEYHDCKICVSQLTLFQSNVKFSFCLRLQHDDVDKVLWVKDCTTSLLVKCGVSLEICLILIMTLKCVYYNNSLRILSLCIEHSV